MRTAWKTLCRLLKISSETTPYLPVAGNGDFPPGLDSAVFRRWTSMGLHYLFQVVQDTGIPTPLTDLQTQFTFLTGDWFAHRQLCHYVRTLTPVMLREEVQSSLREALDLTAQDHVPLKFYHKFLQDLPGELDFISLAQKWSADLQVPISDDMLRKGLRVGHDPTLSSAEKERNYKFLLRAFYPPQRAMIMGISTSPGCGKCSYPMASFGHMFWTCPLVSTFWLTLVSEVAALWGCSWRLHPSFLFTLQIRFHPPKPGCAPFLRKTVIMGRKCILTQWLSPQPPSLQQWRSLMLQQMLLERRDIVDLTAKKGRLFRQCWYLFSLTFVTPIQQQLWTV
uniref:Uncharacterized protein LOC117360377 n=1 Tax=Geotrypetes seraphini TaxID=260995 RepID=A0A6P8RCW2_GEOSA|nr:uncharacterized protein LOC117360377 [Geotrypetes seraphini]